MASNYHLIEDFVAEGWNDEGDYTVLHLNIRNMLEAANEHTQLLIAILSTHNISLE